MQSGKMKSEKTGRKAQVTKNAKKNSLWSSKRTRTSCGGRETLKELQKIEGDRWKCGGKSETLCECTNGLLGERKTLKTHRMHRRCNGGHKSGARKYKGYKTKSEIIPPFSWGDTGRMCSCLSTATTRKGPVSEVAGQLMNQLLEDEN